PTAVPLLVGGVPAVRRIGGGEVLEQVHGDSRAVRRRILLRAGQAVDPPPLEQAERPQVVVERAVLHADDHEGVDRRRRDRVQPPVGRSDRGRQLANVRLAVLERRAVDTGGAAGGGDGR